MPINLSTRVSPPARAARRQVDEPATSIESPARRLPPEDGFIAPKPFDVLALPRRRVRPPDALFAVDQVVRATTADGLAQAATAAGFKRGEQDIWHHPDGSWATFVHRGSYVARGIGGEFLFGSEPAPHFPDVAPTDAVPWTQAVRPFFSGAVNPTRTALLRHGFSENPRGYFKHADGSWVGIIGDESYFGVGTKTVEAASFAPAPCPARSGRREYLELPAKEWAWYQENTALGQLPMISDRETARGVLPEHGFEVTHLEMGIERWSHPDGSYVDFLGPRKTRVGWQSWPLAKLPYNDRFDEI